MLFAHDSFSTADVWEFSSDSLSCFLWDCWRFCSSTFSGFFLCRRQLHVFVQPSIKHIRLFLRDFDRWLLPKHQKRFNFFRKSHIRLTFSFFFFSILIWYTKTLIKSKKTFNSAPTTIFYVVGGKIKSKISYYN